ncbi:PucR family transcriptional regulator [Fictibacillus terranigra]|uniref:PucR family transcriptional regulator ligand-binding domain-containing protein n=1 Tax=Fictibacillus terranigra TaxID=3058424 RepID=A0ABT8EDI7_9BACL|nr:PucR family transcriptional regulator [Fictibacillus sp. CENA-BCM004]MDN4075974.1 PucR family transcriptional regulator ligand-binding domain-containing protein [Fictibacillus sp. CENA-BCM004]
MKFTMKCVLDSDILEPAKVRTAAHNLENIPVEWISVMEYPVENYIRKNEFVLSTAIGCHENLVVFQNFVRDVIDSGAAAMAIALGRYVEEIPEEVLQIAEEHDFPIIELPWGIRFSDITQTVLSKINRWQKKTVDCSEELQKELLYLFLTDGTLSQAADIIEEKTGLPAAIVDTDGILKGRSKNADSLTAKWEEYVQSVSHPELWNPEDYLSKDIGWIYLKDSIIQVKIRTTNKINGFLLLEQPSEVLLNSLFTNGEEYMLEYAATATSLWFQRETTIKETELRLRDDFVWSLAKGEYDSWDHILSRAKSLDYNVNLPYVCILGFAENLESIFEKTEADKATYEQWLQVTTRAIEEQVILSRESIHRKVMATYQRERLIVFLEAPLNQVKDTFNLFLDNVESRLKKRFPGLIMSWGIGENHAGIQTFHDSFNDARIALDIGRRQIGPGYRHTYSNTGILRILVTISKNSDVFAVILSTIGRLIDYDNKRGGDLIHTLTSYIRNQGNVSQTARALHVHRHTLLYRLKKIETLTGRSLMNPDDLFLLDLSIKLWSISHNQE